MLIGRSPEIKRLQKLYKSKRSEFIALYGRRRVGKTFLIRQMFGTEFTFQITGLANVGKKLQLSQFHNQLTEYFPGKEPAKPAEDWFSAFNLLITAIEKKKSKGRKIIFIDELPWLDTRGANFISAIENFWNSWASTRQDIMLIVCGSAASWMINHLINNKGGLHNRITAAIKLSPFNLYETELFLKANGISYNRYQIVLIYMVFGGIPFYLEKLEKGYSAVQNINELCFTKNAPFRAEFDNLYASLFNQAKRHQSIIEALAKKNKGLTRYQIIKLTNLTNGGGLTRILTELEESNFIRKYRTFGKKERDSLYQLTDMYSLFYLNFIKRSSADDGLFWINAIESPTYRSWSGYAFEMVCLHHVAAIKEGLRISGVQTSVYSWSSEAAQVDLVIDRKDQVINLCEMKFSINEYTIDKKYDANLRNKIGNFKMETGSKHSIFLTMISTYGLKENKYSGIVQNDLDMNILFYEQG